MVSPEEMQAVWRACERFVSGSYPQSPKAALTALAADVSEDAFADVYGTGELLESFEAEIAALLGTEAALFLPSGTIAQQSALRVHADRSGVRTVAMHPRNHLDVFERYAYQWLHDLRGIPVGSANRLLTLEALQGIHEQIGTLLVELPQRELGGLLPSWDELVELTGWAREQGMALHMDGARLWECQPWFDRPYAEIVGLFDSAYVSFYKGLGGMAGAGLVGSAETIARARVWQKRHGGTLIHQYPYVLAARRGLQERVGRMGAYHAQAVAIAAELRQLPGVQIVPEVPQTHMMHVYLNGDPERLIEASVAVARERGVFLFRGLRDTPMPMWNSWELSVGDASLDVTPQEVAGLVADVLHRARRDG